MRILFPTIVYEISGGSIYNDLINCLLENNHDVVVCRSNPSVDRIGLMVISNKFSVLEIKTGNQFEKKIFKKGLNMLLLENQFIAGIKENLNNHEFDLILYATPPISLNGVVAYCKRKYKAKAFLMLKDIFPQNAVDLDMMKKNGLIYKFFRRKEHKLYEISDYIGCMSEKNKEYLKPFGPHIYKKSDIFYNSVKFKQKPQNISNNKATTTFLFGGNIGKPQNISTLIKIIDNLRDYSKANFIIVGKGTESFLCEEYARKHNNHFKFYPYMASKEYEKLLEQIDVGIISLDPRFTIANIPSKLSTYCKLGKPILAITDTYTDVKDMIYDADCGWWCSALDYNDIIHTIKKICESKEIQAKKANNAYLYGKKFFNVEKNVIQIEKFMEDSLYDTI